MFWIQIEHSVNDYVQLFKMMLFIQALYYVSGLCMILLYSSYDIVVFFSFIRTLSVTKYT